MLCEEAAEPMLAEDVEENIPIKSMSRAEALTGLKSKLRLAKSPTYSA